MGLDRNGCGGIMAEIFRWGFWVFIALACGTFVVMGL